MTFDLLTEDEQRECAKKLSGAVKDMIQLWHKEGPKCHRMAAQNLWHLHALALGLIAENIGLHLGIEDICDIKKPESP